MSRRTYSQRTLKTLWARSGNLCAFPGCSELLVRDAVSSDRLIVVGEMAHMIALSPEGPRAELDASELNDARNLILLCPTHHTLIDQDPDAYPSEVLCRWKREHEVAVVQAMLGLSSPGTCEHLRSLLARGNQTGSYLGLVFRSEKLRREWRYTFRAEAQCEDVANALAEQHFTPFCRSFTWHLCDGAGKLLKPRAQLRHCGLAEGNTIGLRMTYIARPLDPGASGSRLMYFHHELACSGDLISYIQKWEKHLRDHSCEARELNSLAWMYLEANVDIDRAQALLDRCVELDPQQREMPAVVDSMAWLCYRRGNSLQAEPLLREALGRLSGEDEKSDYYTTLYHLYFVWLSLAELQLAAVARNELLSWMSTWGIDMLMRRRVADDRDALLVPGGCRYLDSAWLSFFGIQKDQSWRLRSSG